MRGAEREVAGEPVTPRAEPAQCDGRWGVGAAELGNLLATSR
jgi:hypothetical protein